LLQVEAEKQEIETEEHLKIMADKEIVGPAAAWHHHGCSKSPSSNSSLCQQCDAARNDTSSQDLQLHITCFRLVPAATGLATITA
jgi:hypothetical protein